VWKQVVIDDVHEDQNMAGGGRVLCHLVEDENTLLELTMDDLIPPAPVNPAVVDDITSLHFIHEAGILHNLQQRSKQNPPKPYT
jgi:myosin heavy subunit